MMNERAWNIDWNGRWNDASCALTRAYVCSYHIITASTTTMTTANTASGDLFS